MLTLTEDQLESITLYYREGGSDKVYQCAIEPSGDQFVVNIAYGRRGSTLTTGTKTSVPVDHPTAKRIFDKLVREKSAKGYTPGPDGTPYQSAPDAGRVTGRLPQLLNPIEDDEVTRLLRDDTHCAQEKFDGRRLLLRKHGAAIDGINRKGLVVGLPETVFQSFTTIPVDCVLDGEAVGDGFHAFDLLEHDGEDLCGRSYRDRLTALRDLLAPLAPRHLRLAESAFSAGQKAILLKTLRQENREGIVFKRLDALYTPGRPNSGGPALKHKFYATLSAVVASLNPQRSVEIRLLDEEGWQLVGNVTIPPNQLIPKIGDVIEVRFLYAFRESGVLFQPVFLGVRSDIDPMACLASQRKFKRTDADER
jgi:bifunctional non-homologous end joining protein LigD